MIRIWEIRPYGYFLVASITQPEMVVKGSSRRADLLRQQFQRLEDAGWDLEDNSEAISDHVMKAYNHYDYYLATEE